MSETILPALVTQTFSRLYLDCWNPEYSKLHCNYWYTVTDSSMPHRGFRTRAALLQWLELFGLSLSEPLPEHKSYGTQRLAGSYRSAWHHDEARFHALQGSRILCWDNGRVTLGIVTRDADGLRTLHTLNTNVSTRPEFDGPKSDALIDAGKAVIAADQFKVIFEGTEHTFPRKEALAIIWRHAHRDSRGIENGVKTVLVLRGGTHSVDLESLTDEEIEYKLAGSIRKELERRAKAGK